MQRLSDSTKFVTPCGDQYKILYESKVEKDGTITLKESGKEDIQQSINSWSEHCDMNFILRQMAQGMFPYRTDAMYGDFTQMPETMAEAMQLMIDAESAFYNLPLETRNKFDNDFKRWLVSANSDLENFAKLMGITPEEAVKTEVKESEE